MLGSIILYFIASYSNTVRYYFPILYTVRLRKRVRLRKIKKHAKSHTTRKTEHELDEKVTQALEQTWIVLAAPDLPPSSSGNNS